MKQSAKLSIYRPAPRKAAEFCLLFTQKNMDIAVILVSLAGLISAAAFLITMS